MGASMQLPRIDRQESMFSQGRSFQPAPGNASLGQVRLRTQLGAFDRQPFLGQQVPTMTTPSTPQVPVTPAPVPPVTPPDGNKNPKPERPRPAMRIAWGRLKKMDAKQLADALAAILERMKARGIPPGMVEKIQARLAGFSATAPETAEVEITEPEVVEMEAQILALEAAEAQDASVNAATPWLVGTGVVIGLGLLVSWLSD